MSLVSRLQERAMGKARGHDAPRPGTMKAQRVAQKRPAVPTPRKKSTQRATKNKESNSYPVESTVVRTPGGICISLRGEDLQWLLSELRGCQGPEPTVHIVFHENLNTTADTNPKLKPEPEPSPPASVVPPRSTPEAPSPAPAVLDTLRVTTAERSFLEDMICPESCDAMECGSSEKYGGLDYKPEAYMISADISDAEWDAFTTF